MARSGNDIILEALSLGDQFRKTSEGLEASLREHGRILLDTVAGLARLEASFVNALSRINENTQRINENTGRLVELGDDASDALAATQVLAGHQSEIATTIRRQLHEGDANFKRLARLVAALAERETEARGQSDELDERLTRAEAMIAKLKRG